jgi:hypothetical protein
MWATTLSVICVICLLMSLILLQLFLHHKTIMAQMKQCVHNIHVHTVLSNIHDGATCLAL